MDSLITLIGIIPATFVVAIVSGFVPFVNAEILLGLALLKYNSIPMAIALGLLVAAGQMISKIGIYKASRGAANLGKHKEDGKLAKARAMMERWKDKPVLLTFISASLGIPPFFLVSIVAGILEMRFATFVTVGFIGRTVRFVTIALVAVLVGNSI